MCSTRRCRTARERRDRQSQGLYCVKTGGRIPGDAYSRRGHFITCCWGNCNPGDDVDGSKDQEQPTTDRKTESKGSCIAAKCNCANGWTVGNYSTIEPPHGENEVEHEEPQSKFPFVHYECYNSDGDSDDGSDDGEDEGSESPENNAKLGSEKARLGAEEAYSAQGEDEGSESPAEDATIGSEEARLGSEEAQLGAGKAYAAKGEDMESLAVSAVRLPPRGAPWW